jgi:hypothetical protein
VAILNLGRSLKGARVVKSTAGLAMITVESPKMTIRVNGDSLFMLHVHAPLEAAVRSVIQPAWHGSFGTNHLLVDEWGGFGLYCSNSQIKDHYAPKKATVATYPLAADDVLWVGVCPPKAYDWNRSLKDHVLYYWSDKEGYPSDEILHSLKAYGNLFINQAEVMQWKDWNLAFVPRKGPREFARFRNTLHKLGMRLMVYTSPFYFFKGMPLESRASNIYPDFKTKFFPNPGCRSGENMGLFLQALKKLLKEHQPDGLYFDGQYPSSAADLYALARESRALLGEKGIIEWHSSCELGLQGDCYVPHADAYVDFQLRGEGAKDRYKDYNYMRFFVSGYNINNCIGVLCNNYTVGVTPELARNVLRVNARLHTMNGWIENYHGNFPNTMKALQEEYFPHLTPALRKIVDKQIDARHAAARWKDKSSLKGASSEWR